jgi:hypothetical protein
MIELEAAGRCLVAYGQEDSCLPAHNINAFTIDRKIIDGMRVATHIYGDERDRAAFYKNNYPPHSVACIRHYHGVARGEYGFLSKNTVELFDKELEPAMEAIETRGHHMRTGRFFFPDNFLDAGKKIGLVGGSDHAGAIGPIHHAATGLWIDNFSAESFFDALWNKRTFAVSNSNTALWVEIDGKPMGSDVVTDGTISIHIQASSPHKILKVSVCCNGKAVQTKEIGTENHVDVTFEESPKTEECWYVAEVETETVYKGEVSHSRSSPFFVSVR